MGVNDFVIALAKFIEGLGSIWKHTQDGINELVLSTSLADGYVPRSCPFRALYSLTLPQILQCDRSRTREEPGKRT